MNDEPQTDDPKGAHQTAKDIGSMAVDKGKKAAEFVDKAAIVAEKTSGLFSAVKWICIAIVTLALLFGGYTIYKVITVPAKAVGNAVEGMSGAVKSGSEKVIENSSEVLNRLLIPADNQARLNTLSEAAFESLTTMAQVPPEGMKERLYRASNFGGHEDRVCKLDIRVGESVLPAALAADNKSYATARALGSKNERLIRMVLTAGDDDVALQAEWNSEAQMWQMRWKSTTLRKPVEDSIAAQRVSDVLAQAAKSCR